MLEFIRSVYRGFVLVAFWVLLAVFAIVGGILGKALSGYSGDYTALGVLLGLFIGFVIDVIIFGFIATILNIDENLEKNNRLLRMQTAFVPTHIVKLLTNADGLSIRDKPNASIEASEKIQNGTKVQFVEKGHNVELNGIKGIWFKIRTQEGTEGWCFSGSLEKI